jgi:small subunit ribosomal protein S15
MAALAVNKAQIIKTYGRATNDTGSSEVQIAILTARINALTEHMKGNPHDFHTRHGLTKLVSQRRRLLRYFRTVNPAGYLELVKKLEIRG